VLNRAQLIGRLGRDAEIRHTGTQKLASLSVATTESWTKDGERHERTEWHRIVCFGADGFIGMIGDRGVKGALVYVEGRIQTRTFTANDGGERSVTEIVVDRMGQLRFLDPKPASTGERERAETATSRTSKATAKPRAEADAKADYWEDEIPF
jgi:single-strand DNA-binding protein